MVSACALTVPVSSAHSPGGPRRAAVHVPTPATHPYLALLAPTPLRYAPAERPPVVLKIEPLPEEVAEQEKAEARAEIQRQFEDPIFDFDLPTTYDINKAIAELDNEPEEEIEEVEPEGPPPIILPEDAMPGAQTQDIMPFFRLPSAPSKATYRKQ